MPRIAKDLQDYLSHPSALLPQPLALDDMVERILQRHGLGGSTTSRYFGDTSGQKLYAVSIYPDHTVLLPGRQIPAMILRSFLQANQALLEDARNTVGTWYNREEDITYLDITTTLPGRAEAVLLAARYNQVAIYDLSRQVEIATAGTGEEIDGLPPMGERLPPLQRGRLRKTNG